MLGNVWATLGEGLHYEGGANRFRKTLWLEAGRMNPLVFHFIDSWLHCLPHFLVI